MRVRTILDNRARFYVSDLPEGAQAEISEFHTHSNAEFHKRVQMGFSTRGIPKTFCTYRAEPDNRWLSIPRGGIIHARDLLRSKWGYELALQDRRTLGIAIDEPIPPQRKTLRPYQQDMLDVARARQFGIMLGGCGSGKTTAGISIIADLQLT